MRWQFQNNFHAEDKLKARKLPLYETDHFDEKRHTKDVASHLTILATGRHLLSDLPYKAHQILMWPHLPKYPRSVFHYERQ